jgi:hypothetical protein
VHGGADVHLSLGVAAANQIPTGRERAFPSQVGGLVRCGDNTHGDTLNYAFKRLQPDEVQEVVCRLMEGLIRKKVLYRWRLFDNFTVAVDGTGMLTFRERHCPYCLTKKLNNGETIYYHPVLEAKLVTANGFVFSITPSMMAILSRVESEDVF